jgi:hypothetical protein
MNILPSKKFILTVVSVLLAGGLVFGAFWYANSSKQSAKTISPEEKKIADQIFVEKDSDNDGLKDWEEIIWKTDSNSADTDGDGIKDGDEVKANKSPLVKGPNDSLIEKAKIVDSTPDIKVKEDNKNITKELAKTFYINYFGSAGKIGSMTSDEATALGTSIYNQKEQVIAPSAKYTIYTEKDLNINPKIEVTRDILKKYTSDVRAAIGVAQVSEEAKIGEVQIIKNALQNFDESELKKLDSIVIGYQKTTTALKKIEIPTSLSKLHLELVNNVSRVGENIKVMQASFNDPTNIIYCIQDYVLYAQKMVANINIVKKLGQN